MHFSSEPDWRICSKMSKSFETLQDSFQFSSTPTWRQLSNEQGLRSVSSMKSQHTWHWQKLRRECCLCSSHLKNRHSLHILCPHGVSTGSYVQSKHMGHTVFPARQISSTTSPTCDWAGRIWSELGESWRVSRELLAGLSKSAESCESCWLHN